ncbi:MAG: hypothetical protein ACYSWO_13690, partial [Planctomycetota bacterium]
MKRGLSISIMAFLLVSCVLTCGVHGQSPEFRTTHDGQGYRVGLVLDGKNVLTSPPEGLWSIATDWTDSWPSGWVHARATEIERLGD